MTLGNSPQNPLKPLPSTAAQLLKLREPYAFQRWRHKNIFARPAQPNTNQPNAKTNIVASSQKQYWLDVQKQYLGRRNFRLLEQRQ